MILTVSQIISRKGIDILLDAVAGIHGDFGIYIVGGNCTEEYKKMLEKYNLKNVHFNGFKTKNILSDYYRAADIFVLPTREDVWGLVINEAMAFGLPIISTDRCIAAMELVENNKNGFIVQAGNAEELKKKITELMNSEEKQLKFLVESLNKIGDYTIEFMADRHTEIFGKIINCNNSFAED